MFAYLCASEDFRLPQKAYCFHIEIRDFFVCNIVHDTAFYTLTGAALQKE